MIKLITGHDDYVKNWLIDRIDDLYRLDNCVTIGVVSNDKLIAGIAYHDHQPEYGMIQISFAAISPMWARQRTIRKLLQYPFIQLRCHKVIVSVKAENLKAIKTFKHIGFIQEAILGHNYGKGKHAVILRMLRPDYDRIFGGENG